jgi:sortase A
MHTHGDRRWLRRAERGLFAAAFLLLGVGALGFFGGRLYQACGVRALEQARGDGVRAPSVIGSGDLVGRIEVPSIGLTSLVIEGTDHKALLLGVGHLEGTALPGEPGQSVLTGHRDTFFRPLENIEVGDTVRVDTSRGTFSYRVVSTDVVTPQEIRIESRGGTPALLLVTCYPFRYVGPAPKRLLVHGAAVFSAAPEDSVPGLQEGVGS